MVHRIVGLLPLLTLLSSLTPGLVLAGEGSDDSSEFSLEDRQRLERGELVSRPTAERGPANVPLVGGTSWQVIDRRPEQVWGVLLDATKYPKTLPQVTRAVVVRDVGAQRTVLIEHGNRLLQLSYYLDVQIDVAARRITFRIDEQRPHDVRSGTGFYLIRPYGRDRTLLVFGVLADIGDRFVAELLRANVQEWMLKVPWLIKRVVEHAPEGGRGPQKTSALDRFRAFSRSSPSCRAASGCD